MNEAAKHLFLSQPSLSETMKELEQEIGMQIFLRSNRGIVITPEGEEFLGYARQVTRFGLLQSRYVEKQTREKFSVSMQHYTFAVNAFVETVSGWNFLTVTNLRRMRRRPMMSWRMCAILRVRSGSHLNDFNEKVMTKIIHEKGLEFTELFACDTYVYLWNGHPLATKAVITMEELDEYPGVFSHQGKNHSLYLAEEMKSTYEYRRLIKATDRATLLNFMKGLNAYTLCSGIICEELNGSEYSAVPLAETEKMRIGYVKRKGATISHTGEIYIEELKSIRIRLCEKKPRVCYRDFL